MYNYHQVKTKIENNNFTYHFTSITSTIIKNYLNLSMTLDYKNDQECSNRTPFNKKISHLCHIKRPADMDYKKSFLTKPRSVDPSSVPFICITDICSTDKNQFPETEILNLFSNENVRFEI